MRSHTHKPLTRRRAIVALSAVTLLVSACGSAGDDDAQADAVASLRDVSTSDGATTDGTDGSAEDTELEAPDDLEEAMALYDQCLQDHGVDPGQGFVVSAGGDTVAVAPAGGATTGNELSDDQVFVDAQDADGKEIPPPDEDLIEAAEACRGHLANATPDFDLSPEQEAAMEDAQLDFQQCMEDHGIEGGGFSISVGGGGPGLAVVDWRRRVSEVRTSPNCNASSSPRASTATARLKRTVCSTATPGGRSSTGRRRPGS